MFHPERTWFVAPVDTPEELARKLAFHSWSLCTAFELRGYLFLNDSEREGATPEFAVVRKPTRPGIPFVQVATITFEWCRLDEASALIRRIVTGDLDTVESARVASPRLETPERHRANGCGYCA